MNFDHWRDVDGFNAVPLPPRLKRRPSATAREIPIDRTYTKLALAQRKQPKPKPAPLIAKAPNYEPTIGATDELNDPARIEARGGWIRSAQPAEFVAPMPVQDSFEFGGETA